MIINKYFLNNKYLKDCCTIFAWHQNWAQAPSCFFPCWWWENSLWGKPQTATLHDTRQHHLEAGTANLGPIARHTSREVTHCATQMGCHCVGTPLLFIDSWWPQDIFTRMEKLQYYIGRCTKITVLTYFLSTKDNNKAEFQILCTWWFLWNVAVKKTIKCCQCASHTMQTCIILSDWRVEYTLASLLGRWSSEFRHRMYAV